MTVDDREAWALFRSRLISPLVDPACSHADRIAYLAYLQAHPPRDPHGQPWVPPVRTLERYQQAYRTGGFDALRPPRRADCGARRTIPAACWEQACRLKREVPERSAAQVLALLTAWAPTVGIDPAVIARIRPSTLYRHWQQAGITRRQLRVAAPKRYRRWEAPAPGALWQSDVMAGPWLPDPHPRDPGRTRQTACLVLLDDYSRRIVAGRWAWQADTAVLEDLLAEALLRYGAPERLYTDNGSIYTSDRFTQICARLHIRLVHTPPYTPAGKGKQERLWGHIQASFVPELRVRPAASLGELNTLFQAWVEEHYHRRVHSETGETPLARWGTGGVHRPVTVAMLRDAFRLEVSRWVDKTGQVSWRGQRWIVPEGLLQTRVTLRWDPHHPDTVEVWHQGQRYGIAVRADQAVPPASGSTPAPPPADPTGLNYLDLLLTRQQARRPGVPYAHDEEVSS